MRSRTHLRRLSLSEEQGTVFFPSILQCIGDFRKAIRHTPNRGTWEVVAVRRDVDFWRIVRRPRQYVALEGAGAMSYILWIVVMIPLIYKEASVGTLEAIVEVWYGQPAINLGTLSYQTFESVS